MKKILSAAKKWSLFLDRDGVLNQRLINDYVKTPEEFRWNDSALKCLEFFAERFGNIVVITNQQGVGKGLMNDKQLDAIHSKMLNDARESGGRINKVYYCPDLENSGSFLRKPSIGMALQARKDFPDINFRRSVMVGDTFTDMLFGKRLKMKTILISPDSSVAQHNAGLVDYWFKNMGELLDFMKNAAATA